MKGRGKTDDRHRFWNNSDQIRTNYLDMHEAVHADLVQTNRCDENSDLSTTYLGKTRMTRKIIVKAEEKFPISG